MNSESNSHDRRAVVIGGSMGGLIAARVLVDFYDEVIILERDALSKEGTHRRGVPHGRHAHGLLAGGQRVIENLFPGISNELIADGACSADALKDGIWFFEGAPLAKTQSDSTGILVSRPLLESTVRKRVRRLDRLEIREAQSVRDLLSYEGRVTGVVTDEGPLAADIIVDATGRGSQAGKWLASVGFRPAREEKVEVQLMYSTRSFRQGNNRIGNQDRFAVVAPTPEGKRGGVIAQQENDQWIVTLFGHFGHVAPLDLEGFIEFAKSLPSPVIFNAIRGAEPIGDGVQFRFPASTRRRYEDTKEFPEGFLVFGDAICSFNPIYGQGMSVAALQAHTLYEALEEKTVDVARRFFRKAAKVIDSPWQIAVGSDLRIRETIGPRSLGVRLINAYVANVHKHAHTDLATAIAFIRVAQLLEPPSTLMRPGLLARVMAGNLRRRFESNQDLKESLLTTVEPRRQVRSE